MLQLVLHNCWLEKQKRNKRYCVYCTWISIIRTRRIPSEKPLSKDSNHVPWRISDVFIDSEDEHEDEEEACASKEVPDVMPDINSWSVSTQINEMVFLQHAHPS